MPAWLREKGRGLTGLMAGRSEHGQCDDPGVVATSSSPAITAVGVAGYYLACPAGVRRRLAVIASHSDSIRMTIPSRACSLPIHLLLSPSAASAV
jgi:hypothetical protein